MINKEFIVEDNNDGHYLGVVVDPNDPEKSGRARIRIFGKFDDLKDDELPWAIQSGAPMFFGGNGACGAFSTPRKGAVVGVDFNNGNIYSPEYYSIQEANPDMMNEISGSYENAHSIIYDTDENLKMFYTKEKGISIILKDSKINIANDNAITIEHSETKSIIELRGGVITMTSDSEINMTAGSRIKATAPEIWLDGKETKTGHVPAYKQVLGEPLFAFLKILSAAVDVKLFPTPSAMTSACATAEQLSLSDTCKVSK
jgi:hypothetical protein